MNPKILFWKKKKLLTRGLGIELTICGIQKEVATPVNISVEYFSASELIEQEVEHMLNQPQAAQRNTE